MSKSREQKQQQAKAMTDEEALKVGEALFVSLGDYRVADLICGGLECGSYATFGLDTSKYVKPKVVWSKGDSWPVENPFRHIQYPLSEGGAATLFCRYDEEEGEEEREFKLDLLALKRGLARFVVGYPHLFAEVLKDNEDALVSDAYLQCCLLNEVVYG